MLLSGTFTGIFIQGPFFLNVTTHFHKILCFSTPRRELESVFLAFKTILTGLMSSFERSIKLRNGRFPTRFRMKESVREKVAFRRELVAFFGDRRSYLKIINYFKNEKLQFY